MGQGVCNAPLPCVGYVGAYCIRPMGCAGLVALDGRRFLFAIVLQNLSHAAQVSFDMGFGVAVGDGVGRTAVWQLHVNCHNPLQSGPVNQFAGNLVGADPGGGVGVAGSLGVGVGEGFGGGVNSAVLVVARLDEAVGWYGRMVRDEVWRGG